MMKWLRRLVILLAVLAFLFVGFLAYNLVPTEDPQPLPSGLVSIASPQGEALLADADAFADYQSLNTHFEAQDLRSFCGVASTVIVLNALDRDVSQVSVFNDRAADVRSYWQTATMGMTIEVLAGILEAHDVETAIVHADEADTDQFRDALIGNLASEGDYLLVNYQREELGQERVGHISPVAAYDRETDRILILDTAAYKYPYTWVPVPEMHAAMAAVDGESGKSRGWIEVSD